MPMNPAARASIAPTHGTHRHDLHSERDLRCSKHLADRGSHARLDRIAGNDEVGKVAMHRLVLVPWQAISP